MAVAGQQARGYLVRLAGEVDQDAAALRRRGGEMCRLREGEPGVAAIERAVDQFADEAAVQHLRPGAGQHGVVLRE